MKLKVFHEWKSMEKWWMVNGICDAPRRRHLGKVIKRFSEIMKIGKKKKTENFYVKVMSRFYFLYQSNVIFPFWNWNIGLSSAVTESRKIHSIFQRRMSILMQDIEERNNHIHHGIYLPLNHGSHFINPVCVCMSRWAANDFSHNIIDMSSEQASLSRSVCLGLSFINVLNVCFSSIWLVCVLLMIIIWLEDDMKFPFE